MDGKTIWELAMDAFNETGIEIYPPATKNGECKNPYVVLKTEGSTQIPGYSSEYHYYSFLCYVPQNQYSELEKLKSKVKKVLSDKMYPILMPTGEESTSFFDSSIKAHMSYIMYRNNVRNKHL